MKYVVVLEWQRHEEFISIKIYGESHLKKEINLRHFVNKETK